MTYPIVEVTVTGPEGERVPLGLMNSKQALALPQGVVFEASHPDHEAGSTDLFIDRDTLQDHVDAKA